MFRAFVRVCTNTAMDFAQGQLHWSSPLVRYMMNRASDFIMFGTMDGTSIVGPPMPPTMPPPMLPSMPMSPLSGLTQIPTPPPIPAQHAASRAGAPVGFTTKAMICKCYREFVCKMCA